MQEEQNENQAFYDSQEMSALQEETTEEETESKEALQAQIAELKEQYRAGGLGDVKIKRYLNEVLEAELGPIRARREEFAKDIPAVYAMLKEGSEKANEVANKTLEEVRRAIGVNYFDNI